MNIGSLTNNFNNDLNNGQNVNVEKVLTDFNIVKNYGMNYIYDEIILDSNIIEELDNKDRIDSFISRLSTFNNNVDKIGDSINLAIDEMITSGEIGNELDGIFRKIGKLFKVAMYYKYCYIFHKTKIMPILKITSSGSVNSLSFQNGIKNLLSYNQFNWVNYLYIDQGNFGIKQYIDITSSIKNLANSNNIKLICDLFAISNGSYTDWNSSRILNIFDNYIFDYNISENFKFNEFELFMNEINNKFKNKNIFVLYDYIFSESRPYDEQAFKEIKQCLLFAKYNLTVITKYIEKSLLYEATRNKYKYVFDGLYGYMIPTTPNKIYDDVVIESVSLSDEEDDDVVTVIWLKIDSDKEITIFPNPNEYLILMSGEQVKIINKYSYTNKKYDFMLIKQKTNKNLLNHSELNNLLLDKRLYEDKHINGLLGSLPNTYNTTSEITNLYKLLRAINFDFADAEANMAITRDNAYLLSVKDDSIYKNFGILAKLNHENDWDNNKYRAFVSGVIKSLLEGPTLESIQDAINLFINYDYELNGGKKVANINVIEAYTEQSSQDSNLSKIMAMFTFYVEIENINEGQELSSKLINEDVRYIIKILKPAHTLAILLVAYSREEDYRKWYCENRIDEFGNNKDFETMDEYGLEYVYEVFEQNYNNIPYSFITFGEFSVENAKSITHEDHLSIFNDLVNEDIVKYGSLTPDDTGSADPSMFVGEIGTAGIFDTAIVVDEHGNETETNLITPDDNVKRVCYNRYPLGIISRIFEEEFKIEIIN